MATKAIINYQHQWQFNMFYAIAEAPNLKHFREFLSKLENVKYISRVKSDRFNNRMYKLSSSKNNGKVALVMVTYCNNQLIPSIIEEFKAAFKDAKIKE